MADFWDLHCHYVLGVDDGARTLVESQGILEGLAKLGFSRVIGTPHMRPGLFNNSKEDLQAAYAKTLELLAAPLLPELGLASEHYFDDVVFQRVLSGEGLPYPGGRAVLFEFYEVSFPYTVDHRLADVRRHGLLPIIAHPERYRAIWSSPDILERLVDGGAGALLDVAALAGKYGRQPQKSAEELLKRGLYHAACSDAHRPEDIDAVRKGMQRVDALYGAEEIQFLFHEGPRALLEGHLPS
ncbi:MAG: CpsB/CapC family capsule biosynthesis tyrosine phosphatase [Polyangiaceae bacterium]|nr:CpsB/CapC family capsule biosynthesis tyrosine phosphatase [Polyangiaceae bacterium]